MFNRKLYYEYYKQCNNYKNDFYIFFKIKIFDKSYIYIYYYIIFFVALIIIILKLNWFLFREYFTFLMWDAFVRNCWIITFFYTSAAFSDFLLFKYGF